MLLIILYNINIVLVGIAFKKSQVIRNIGLTFFCELG